MLGVVAAASDWTTAELLSRRITDQALVSQAQVDATGLRQGAIWLLQVLMQLGTGVAFIVWFHRAYTNMPSLDARSLRFSSGWTIGGWSFPSSTSSAPSSS